MLARLLPPLHQTPSRNAFARSPVLRGQGACRVFHLRVQDHQVHHREPLRGCVAPALPPDGQLTFGVPVACRNGLMSGRTAAYTTRVAARSSKVSPAGSFSGDESLLQCRVRREGHLGQQSRLQALEGPGWASKNQSSPSHTAACLAAASPAARVLQLAAATPAPTATQQTRAPTLCRWDQHNRGAFLLSKTN